MSKIVERQCEWIEDGVRCKQIVRTHRDARYCKEHFRYINSISQIKTGAGTKYLRTDIADEIRKHESAFANTLPQEALVRWSLEQWKDRFQNEECTFDEFWVNILGGVETLSRVMQRRQQTELAASRVITPEQFYALCTRIGAEVQTWVSDPVERQGLAQAIAGIIRGNAKINALVRPDLRELPANATPVDIVQKAVLDD